MNRTWRVTRIGDNAFWGCNGMLSVTIPNSVTSIGEQAFAECDIPEIISRIVNPFSISADTFSDNTYSTATLYVPAGTIDKYKAVQGWKKFANIKAGNPSDISNIETKGPQEINRYALNGRVVKGIHKGINIIQMNNGTTKKVIIK